jgi:hypothetical protein
MSRYLVHAVIADAAGVALAGANSLPRARGR